MGCGCNSCKDPLVLPIGPIGKTGPQGPIGPSGLTPPSPPPGATGGIGATGNDGDDGKGYDAISATSIDVLNTLATSTTAVITVEKAYTPGARVRFSDTASPAVNYFEGICTAYSAVSGNISVGSIDVFAGSGVITSWDVNVTGETGVAGAAGANGSDIYDSGWKTMNDYTAGKGFGLPTFTNWTHPSIRVIGKTVFIDGKLLMPLSSDTGSTFVTDANSYKTAVGSAYVQIYKGTDFGYTMNTGGSITMKKSMVPTNLQPSSTHVFNQNVLIQRPILSTGTAKGLVLSSWGNALVINTSGQFAMSTHKDQDDSAGTPVPDSPIHLLLSNHTLGDFAPNYSAFKNSFTGAVDNRTSPVSTSSYPATFDAEDEDHQGGFFVNITTSYPVDESLTEQQIIDAFNSI
tara:strand:+ start:2766 stop:3977 length:1212 start_codon:yes stop_codon:yes gene_type:complete